MELKQYCLVKQRDYAVLVKSCIVLQYNLDYPDLFGHDGYLVVPDTRNSPDN